MSEPLARGGGTVGLAVPMVLGLICGLALLVDPRLVPVLAVGALGAWAGVKHPQLLVLLIFVAILFDKLGATSVKVAKLPVTASKLAVVSAIGLWGLHAMVRKVAPARGHAVLYALVAVVIATGLATAWSDCFDDGRYTLLGLAMVTVLTGLVYVILADRRLGPMYRALSGVVVVALLASLAGGSTVDDHGRASGTFGDPNEWASLVLLVVPTLLGGLAEDRHPLARVLRLGLIGLAPLAILQSGSRSALLVGALAGLGSLVVLRNNRGELALCAGAGVLLAPLVVDVGTALERLERLVGRFTGSATMVTDSSLDERGELLRQGLQLFQDHWFMGAGPGRFAKATGFISLDGRYRPAHNTYLEIAGEQGIFGLTVFLVFLAVVAWTVAVAHRRAPSAVHRARVAGVGIGLGCLALMSATLGMLTFSMAYLVLGLGLAVVHQAMAAAHDGAQVGGLGAERGPQGGASMAPPTGAAGGR